MQKFKRAREINAGHVILPLIGVMLVEVIAQIKNVIGGDDTFTGEHVNPIGNGARFSQARRFAPDHLLQVAQAAREHIGRWSKPGSFRRTQKIHNVNGIEADLLFTFRRPVTERALIVLAASQKRKSFFELCIYLGAIKPKIDLVRQKEPAESAARDLLAAAMGKIFQKNVKTVSKTERDGCDRSFAFGEFGIDCACNPNVDVSFLEISAANIGRIGDRWTDAQRSAPARLDPISTCHEFDLGRAECVVHMESKRRALLPPFRDSQFLRRRSQDRQVRGCVGAQIYLGICAGAFDIVRYSHACLKFIARSGQHRYAWRNDKRSANEGIAVGGSRCFIRNTNRHYV